MAGPQKENKTPGVKTTEKKGGTLKKGDPPKQVVADCRSPKTPKAEKANKREKPEGTKGGRQSKPHEAKEPVRITTTANNAGGDNVKTNEGNENKPSSEVTQGEEPSGATDTTSKTSPVVEKDTPKPGTVMNQKQKTQGSAPKTTQKPESGNQKTGGAPKTGAPGNGGQKDGTKTSKSTTGTPKSGAVEQKPGGGPRKQTTGTQQKSGVGSENKSTASTPRGKATPSSGKSTPKTPKGMETPTRGIGKPSTGETPPATQVMRPEESKSPKHVGVSSETPVAETSDERRASKASMVSSKISDMSLKLDLSSSSSGLPSLHGSAVGVHTPRSSATGSVGELGDSKIPGIDITTSSDSEIKAGEHTGSDGKVFTDSTDIEKKNDKLKQDSGRSSIEKVGEEKTTVTPANNINNEKCSTEAKDITKVESNQQNSSVNSNANNASAVKTDDLAKQVIAVTDTKGKLVDGNSGNQEKSAVPVPVLVPGDAKVETSAKENKEVTEKSKDVKVVKEAKDVPKEEKDNKSKETKTKSGKKETDVKDSKQKESKDKEVVGKKDAVVVTQTDQVQDTKSPREIKELRDTKKTKSSKNLFSNDSGKDAPGKAEKVDKTKKKENKNSKNEKGNKKEPITTIKPPEKKGISAWSKISTKNLLAGAQTMSGEGKQNGSVERTNVSEIGRKESMSALTVPNSNSLDDNRQGKPDAKSLRSTGSRLSVTSARRWSMESRRSVDIRGGLLNAPVINPPGEDKPKSLVSNEESFIQTAIPTLPLPAAVMCLLMNILIPGFGTVISGFGILCCGKPRVNSKTGDLKTITFCVNVWVGLAQLFTVTFCLVGWAWSIGWGIRMVGHSLQHRREMKELREKTLQTMALNAFAGSPVRRMMGFA